MPKQSSKSRGSSRRPSARKSNSNTAKPANPSHRRKGHSPQSRPTNRSEKKPADDEDYSQRLNKVLAAAGLGSRRQVEELIEQERVVVDNEICTDLSRRVDPRKNKISVDGEALKPPRPRYYALHKPAGVLCTNRDPQGRPRAIDLVPDASRLFPIGRLDANSTGLIILTNDGELTQRLAHPKYQVNKTYFVIVQGRLDVKELARLRKGIRLAEGWAKVENVKIRRYRRSATELEMVLSEGKNREIRRVLARLGHKVMVLRRLAIGPLRLANLPEGAHRKLTQDEVQKLYAATQNHKRKSSTENNGKQNKKKRPPQPSKQSSTAKQIDSSFSNQQHNSPDTNRSGEGRTHKSTDHNPTNDFASQNSDPKKRTSPKDTSHNTDDMVLVSEHSIPASEVPTANDSGWDDWDSTPEFLKSNGPGIEFQSSTGNVIDFGDESSQGFDSENIGLSIEDLLDEDSEFEENEFEGPTPTKPPRRNPNLIIETGTETAPADRKPTRRKKGNGKKSPPQKPGRRKSSKNKRSSKASDTKRPTGRRGAARATSGRRSSATSARKPGSKGSSGRGKSKRR